jgi:tRNA(adenine34) deaminase
MKQDVDIVIKLKENQQMNNNEIYMREAYKEALKAYKKNEVPIGCVIVKDNKIIAKAHNLRNSKKNSLYHAEVLAIDKACKKLKKWILDDCTLYVTMEPCVMCAGSILQARIQKVVYGIPQNRYGCVGTLMNLFTDFEFNNSPIVEKGIMEEEIKKLVSNFFVDLRKKKQNNVE